ncbi:hypothetical protein RRG08_031548 [Elysia crispata]|uniref:G-protein coupled receptors family 1 profile domain-containing protein n=1 Tax=Elysia crispata TaxID=231223 RepID=A0AAE1AFT6_9GAST|nr:hypothetical protein RRG08_031548 [Elysia crispata]
MSGDTTPPSPLINSSLINMLDANTSYIGNNSNGTDTRAEDKLGLALFALPQIPAWLSSLYLSMLCLSILIGVPGNTLTVVAYARIKAKTSCDWYILIVAWADLVSCLFRSPVYIMEHLGVWLHHSNSDLCKVISWLSQITVCVSIFIFALIAIDRYVKLCCNFSWNISPTRARNISIIMILVNSLLAAPCLYIFENLSRGVCTVKSHLLQTMLVKGYYSLIFVLFLMMFTAVVFCYINIAIKVRKTKRVGTMPVGRITLSTGRSAEDEDMTATSQDHAHREGISENFPGRRNANFAKDLTANSSDPYPASKSRTSGTVEPRLASGNTDQHSPAIMTLPRAMTSSNSNHLLNAETDSDGKKSSLKPGVSHSVSYGSNLTDQSNKTEVPLQMLGNNKAESPGSGPLLTVKQQHVELRRENPIVQVSEMSRRKAVMRQQRNLRITRLLFVVTAVFILSWVPPYIAMVKGFYIGYSFPLTLTEMLLLSYGPSVYVINTFSNPIIYAALSAIYRRHVIDLWKALRKTVNTICCRR